MSHARKSQHETRLISFCPPTFTICSIPQEASRTQAEEASVLIFAIGVRIAVGCLRIAVRQTTLVNVYEKEKKKKGKNAVNQKDKNCLISLKEVCSKSYDSLFHNYLSIPRNCKHCSCLFIFSYLYFCSFVYFYLVLNITFFLRRLKYLQTIFREYVSCILSFVLFF